jgi:hypothetical protein
MSLVLLCNRNGKVVPQRKWESAVFGPSSAKDERRTGRMLRLLQPKLLIDGRLGIRGLIESSLKGVVAVVGTIFGRTKARPTARVQGKSFHASLSHSRTWLQHQPLFGRFGGATPARIIRDWRERKRRAPFAFELEPRLFSPRKLGPVSCPLATGIGNVNSSRRTAFSHRDSETGTVEHQTISRQRLPPNPPPRTCRLLHFQEWTVGAAPER